MLTIAARSLLLALSIFSRFARILPCSCIRSRRRWAPSEFTHENELGLVRRLPFRAVIAFSTPLDICIVERTEMNEYVGRLHTQRIVRHTRLRVMRVILSTDFGNLTEFCTYVNNAASSENETNHLGRHWSKGDWSILSSTGNDGILYIFKHLLPRSKGSRKVRHETKQQESVGVKWGDATDIEPNSPCYRSIMLGTRSSLCGGQATNDAFFDLWPIATREASVVHHDDAITLATDCVSVCQYFRFPVAERR